MPSLRDDWWDPALSSLTPMPALRGEDAQRFGEKLTPYDALHQNNDARWTETFGDFIDRDRRFYIAALARYLHNSKREFVRLQPFNMHIAPSVFGELRPDGQRIKTLVGRLRKWAEREDKEGLFSVDKASVERPNVDCVFFTSKQKLRLLVACPPPVVPGPFDLRHPISQFP